MVKDERLDDYNRVLMYYLFLNYAYNLPKEQLLPKRKLLAEAAKSLPEYLAQQAEKGEKQRLEQERKNK